MPANCPSCGESVVRREDEAMSYCVNASCPEQLVRLVEHFVSRGAMDIEGLGEKWGAILIAQGLIRDVADLYYLKQEHLAQMNLLDAISAAKSNDFATVLDRIGIPNVGKKSAGIIAGVYDSFEGLSIASQDDLTQIDGINRRVADGVVAYFHDQDYLCALKQKGRAFAEQGLLEAPTDLYYVNRKYLLRPETLRQKSATNLLDAIEKSKSRPLTRVLVALGIAHVGSEVAGVLARHFGSIERIRQAGREEIEELNSIGPKIADAVVEYFENESNCSVVDKLIRAGVNVTEDTSSEVGNGVSSLKGLRFVVTGRLASYSRSAIQDRIKELGGSVSGSVSKRTDYLVAGEDAGSKLTEARKLEVEVLSEEGFESLLSEKTGSHSDKQAHMEIAD